MFLCFRPPGPHIALHRILKTSWGDIRKIFSYPAEIHHAIYTTHAIDSLNSMIRHPTKKKKIYSSDDSVTKVIYLATSNTAKKCTIPIQNGFVAQRFNTCKNFDFCKNPNI
ncbi:transposase [Acinetobacter sp. WZC-1]|uniref:transposase n=1 Tax=Acinetobacter sp. WZC-1 TaxID=3459034 RepID=UPI00403D7428